MPVNSMTGFGRGTARGDGMSVLVEISSVNRRQLDARMNLPRSLGVLEVRVMERIRERLDRGQVSISVKVERKGGASRAGLMIDREVAAAYVGALRETAKRLGLRDDLSASVLTNVAAPIVDDASALEPEQVWPVMEAGLKRALDQLCAMRLREGRNLERDLSRRLAVLGRMVGQIERRAPLVLKRHRAQLRKRLAEAGVPVAGNDPQLLREVVVFCERCDITEETVRLRSHMKQFKEGLRKGANTGRTLDFLCQEMFREINTIGSKANDAELSREVVAFKSVLEAIREQVQNVQ